MTDREPELEALRAAIRGVAEAGAPQLVAEARAEAFARVRSMLTDAIARELVDRSADLLDERAAPPRPSTPARPAKRAPARPPAPEPAGETACYAYGVMRDAPDDVAGIPGVDGVHPTRVVEHAGLAALVSDVPLSEFGEEPLLENLNDVTWLERTARAHEHVLDAALAGTTVVPVRLCTIYNGDEQVREMLERERSALREALERLTGKTEWGVKVIAAPGVLEATLTAEDGVQGRAASAGAAYLEARQREARAGERVEEVAAEWADAIHERVASAAAEALRNPLQAPDIAGYEGEMLLNGVYLVDDASDENFQALVADLATEWEPRGVAVELTGPWPPYNFVKSSIEAAR